MDVAGNTLQFICAHEYKKIPSKFKMSPPVWPKTGNLMNLAVDLSLYYSSWAICSVLAPYLLIIKGIITS